MNSRANEPECLAIEAIIRVDGVEQFGQMQTGAGSSMGLLVLSEGPGCLVEHRVARRRVAGGARGRAHRTVTRFDAGVDLLCALTVVRKSLDDHHRLPLA